MFTLSQNLVEGCFFMHNARKKVEKFFMLTIAKSVLWLYNNIKITVKWCQMVRNGVKTEGRTLL